MRPWDHRWKRESHSGTVWVERSGVNRHRLERVIQSMVYGGDLNHQRSSTPKKTYLRYTSCTVSTAHIADVTSPVFWSTAVSSFLRLHITNNTHNTNHITLATRSQSSHRSSTPRRKRWCPFTMILVELTIFRQRGEGEDCACVESTWTDLIDHYSFSRLSCLHDFWTVRFNVVLLPMLRSVNVSYRMYCLHGVATLSGVGPAH